MKTHLLKASLILFFIAFTAQVVDAATVKFKKPDAWQEVHVYAWGGATTAEPFGAWPGLTLTETDGWYECSITETVNLIFNNNDGSQTVSANTTVSSCYQTDGTANADGHLQVQIIPCEEGGITVKFQKPVSWTNVHLYAYVGEDGVLGGWPGLKLAAQDGWYSYTFDASITAVNIIYNNGDGMQLPDKFIEGDVCFNDILETVSCDLPTSIQVESAAKLTVYPNPVADQLFINSTFDVEKLVIYSITGSKVLETNLLQSGQPINVASLNQGFYFVTVISPDGNRNTIKIRKE